MDEKDKILVIYLDGIIVFSHYDEEHVAHLLRMFKKVQKIRHLSKSKEVIICYEGKEAVGAHNFLGRHENISK